MPTQQKPSYLRLGLARLLVRLAKTRLIRTGRNHQTHDQAVQAQRFGENEDEDEADEELAVGQGVAAHTGVADDADSVTSSNRGHANGDARAEEGEAGVLYMFELSMFVVCYAI